MTSEILEVTGRWQKLEYIILLTCLLTWIAKKDFECYLFFQMTLFYVWTEVNMQDNKERAL